MLSQGSPALASLAGVPATISRLFATPVACLRYQDAQQFNEKLAELIVAKAATVKNRFTYKAGETAADLAGWGEPIIDRLSAWMLQMVRAFVENIVGSDLNAAYSINFNTDKEGGRRVVSPIIGTSWASIYRRGHYHEAHMHPNTAVTAIYYVKAPGTCELDLLDPRPNISYFDPGIVFGGDEWNVRLTFLPGDLVLFPGWLKHAVPRFDGEGERISISWNVGYVVRTHPAKG